MSSRTKRGGVERVRVRDRRETIPFGGGESVWQAIRVYVMLIAHGDYTSVSTTTSTTAYTSTSIGWCQALAANTYWSAFSISGTPTTLAPLLLTRRKSKWSPPQENCLSE